MSWQAPSPPNGFFTLAFDLIEGVAEAIVFLSGEACRRRFQVICPLTGLHLRGHVIRLFDEQLLAVCPISWQRLERLDVTIL
jgi:hypothetical protein